MGLSARDHERFSDLDFEGFRELARDESLHPCERIGFPRSYREGREAEIFADIAAKTKLLRTRERRVIDIGPGCSELAQHIIDACRDRGHELLLIDSPEMLNRLPDDPWITKLAGSFPTCLDRLPKRFLQSHTVLCYSVFHYVFAHQNPFEFLDATLRLVEHGGEVLIGDVPNYSKRRRFFASAAGRKFHREFTGREDDPEVRYGHVLDQKIDDAAIAGFLGRAQAAGFDAYQVPQAPELPLANRRDDLLFQKPEQPPAANSSQAIQQTK